MGRSFKIHVIIPNIIIIIIIIRMIIYHQRALMKGLTPLQRPLVPGPCCLSSIIIIIINII